MTAHIAFDYQCPKCYERYMPFDDKHRKCPKCGDIALEKYSGSAPSIKRILQAAKRNVKAQVFGMFSTADHYIFLTVFILKNIVADPTNEKEAEQVVNEILPKIDFEGAEHKRQHLSDFVKIVVREILLEKKEKADKPTGPA